jgi:nucleoside-diphosphate-sugar epimerase
MKAFITGANGFIGSFLVEKLLEQNFEVTCLVRKTSNLRWIKNLPIRFEYGDVTNFDSLIDAVKTKDYIFHCGGIVRARTESDFLRVNYSGSKNLLEVCKQHNPNLKRFVYVSSQAAAGPSVDGIPITETIPPNPISNYGRSKLQGEEITREYSQHFSTTIIRPPSVYGPRDSDILTIFKYVKSGIKPKIGRKEKRISIVHVNDLVRGIILAAKHKNAENETFHISNQQNVSVKELMNLIAQVMDKNGIEITVPEFLLDIVAFFSENLARLSGKVAILNRDKVREMKQQYWLVDSNKAEKKLRFSSEIDIKDGLKQTYLWYQKQGWL